MVSTKEKIARIKDYYTFNSQEKLGLVIGMLVTGFLFSFRDWGAEQFEVAIGLTNFVLACFAALLLFVARFTLQKWYGLAQGYKVTFKPWWIGMAIAVVITFITNGWVPLILVGGVSVAFISKHRLGEFRYGFSYWQNGIISLWAVYSSVIMATLFGLGSYFFPSSYFFDKGLSMSIMMGFLVLLPLPQLEAFSLYYAEAWLYIVAIVIMALAAALLLSKALIGIIICIVVLLLAAVIYYFAGSHK